MDLWEIQKGCARRLEHDCNNRLKDFLMQIILKSFGIILNLGIAWKSKQIKIESLLKYYYQNYFLHFSYELITKSLWGTRYKQGTKSKIILIHN